MTETTKEIAGRAKQIVRVRADGIHRPDDADGFLSVIAAAAADPRCNVEKMQALLAMQKEVVAEQARLAYTAAKLALTDDLPVINKDGKIEFKDKGQGAATLKFASFENINRVLKPLLREHRFDLWFSSEPGVAGMVNVIGHLDHAMGHTRQTVFPLPHDGSGGKSGSQGWASAFSFGKRITTIGLLNIQTTALEDRDRDGNPNNFKQAKGGGFAEVSTEVEKVTAKQRDEIVRLITSAGITESQFCQRFEIAQGQVGFLPMERFEEAKLAIADHVKAKRTQ